MARHRIGVLLALGMLPSTAGAQPPEAKAAIARGVGYLRKNLGEQGEFGGGQNALAAYAMIKGGAKPTDPAVAKVIGGLTKSLASGKYKGVGHGIYAAGCELMLLEAAAHAVRKPGLYRKEMQVIVDFVRSNQGPGRDGFWTYIGEKHGDTSVTQYGVLGLWAAERAGIKIPPQTWENAAFWLMRYQKKDGGFEYRPTEQDKSHGETLSMSVAGTSTLLVARRFLYPNAGASKPKKKKTPQGPLEDVEEDPVPGKPKPKKPPKFTPRIPLAQLNRAIGSGMGWVHSNYRTAGFKWPLYTMYGTERLAALARVRRLGRVEWYADGVAYLVKHQKADGSWDSPDAGQVAGTSFAILFLSKATQGIIGKIPDRIGDGLLRGAIGLPTDLSTLEEGKGGVIKKRRKLGPIDELLEELKKPKNLTLPEVQREDAELQNEIVKRIQTTERKQWLKPERRKELLQMAEHRSPSVRKVAVWALGRTGNIDVVTVVMNALEKDPDLDVAVEARNALCWLSRKPRGFGLPEQPDVANATDEADKLRIIERWREDAVERWKKWYLSVRPYRERDDLSETGELPN